MQVDVTTAFLQYGTFYDNLYCDAFDPLAGGGWKPDCQAATAAVTYLLEPLTYLAVHLALWMPHGAPTIEGGVVSDVPQLACKRLLC